MLRVANFDELDMINTDGVALTIYFNGCHFHCKGCHNKELQDFSGGTEYDFNSLLEKTLELYNKGEYDYVCYCGGEPLDQYHDELRVFTEKLTEAGVKVWMYTGYDYDEVPSWCKRMMYCIKCGRYDTSFVKEGKLATGNQTFYFKDGRREK